MIRLSVLFIVLVISLNSFAQSQKCKEGSFYFYKNKEGFSKNPTLVKDGMIIPSNSIQKLFCINIISKDFSINSLENDNLQIKYLKTNTISNVSFNMLDTKASLSFCVDEFTEKLKIFFDEDLTQINMNTPKGIPFLTFTLVE